MRDPPAVIDADVAIKLARVSLLDKVLKEFAEIHLTTGVRRELRLDGPRRRRRDVERFKKAAVRCLEWDRTVFNATLAELRYKDPRKSHRGESEAIAQAALDKRIRFMLSDDRDATAVARRRGLIVLSFIQLTNRLAPDDAEIL